MNDEQTTRPLPPQPDDRESPPAATAAYPTPAATAAYPTPAATAAYPTPAATAAYPTPAPTSSATVAPPTPAGPVAGDAPAEPRTHGRDGTGNVRLFEPQQMPWFMGIVNVLFSAVLTVTWIWIPLGLFVSGVGGIFALGAGIFFLVVWYYL